MSIGNVKFGDSDEFGNPGFLKDQVLPTRSAPAYSEHSTVFPALLAGLVLLLMLGLCWLTALVIQVSQEDISREAIIATLQGQPTVMPILPGARLSWSPGVHPGYPALVQAKARWSARPFSGYRLVLRRGNPLHGETCRQDVSIQDDNVIYVALNTCPRLSTISDLFKQLEDDMAYVHWGPNGVGCDVRAVYPVYDPQLGYPLQIDYRQEHLWEAAVPPLALRIRPGPCTLMAALWDSIEIVSLTPLPTSINF
jgi:hypothetical protein